MYYTYLLRCADNSLYTGITVDLDRRLAEHRGQGGRGARYTAAKRPLRYEAAWACLGRSEAQKLEARIKGLTKDKKEALILGKVPADFPLDHYEKIL